MPDINDFRAQRAEKNDAIQALAALEAAGTNLSDEQLKQFDQLSAEFKGLSEKIVRMESAEAAAAMVAKPISSIQSGGYGGLVDASGFAIKTKEKKQTGANLARMMQAIGATGRTGREAAHYAEMVLGDSDVAAALSTDVTTAGGVLVPKDFIGEIIELWTPRSVVRSLGANPIPMPHGNVTIPKQTGGATATYVGENKDIVASQPTFADLQLSSKTLATLVPASNQLINFNGISPALERLLISDALNAIALREDLAFIRGDGTNNTPKGIKSSLAAANVLVANATISNATIDSDLRKMILALMNANAMMVRCGWIMSPRSAMYLSGLKDAQGNFIYRGMDGENKTLLGYPVKTTTQVPTNLGAGAESEIYFGDFNDAMIGESNNFTIDISKEASYIDAATGTLVSAFSRNQMLFRIVTDNDFGLRHDGSFVLLTKVLW